YHLTADAVAGRRGRGLRVGQPVVSFLHVAEAEGVRDIDGDRNRPNTAAVLAGEAAEIVGGGGVTGRDVGRRRAVARIDRRRARRDGSNDLSADPVARRSRRCLGVRQAVVAFLDVARKVLIRYVGGDRLRRATTGVLADEG